jgi:hypothetical protein
LKRSSPTCSHAPKSFGVRNSSTAKRSASAGYRETAILGATAAGFARMIERAGIEAWVGLKVHPHMLR